MDDGRPAGGIDRHASPENRDLLAYTDSEAAPLLENNHRRTQLSRPLERRSRMMPATTDGQILLDCYDTGRRIQLPFEEAQQRFSDRQYAWLVPTDFYRWNIDGHAGQNNVRVILPCARSFGLHLHTRSTKCFTLSALCALEDTILDPRALHKRAARFGELFGNLPRGLRPFFYYKFVPPGGLPQPAYCMHPDRTWFVIMGVVDTQAGDDFDWWQFEHPS